ncbi:type II toxin-antitoxin system HipA family toxin YjjJ [uncultured Aquabacterium sp.]|uniref:type II toxin-antitoxin system HipA family toxin YjjJ n=1 Tax=uncultured Aquabacterium sp. TaxID=158753 RepID=UPI0030D3A500
MSADTLIAFLRQQANRPGGTARVPAGRVLEGLGISRPTLMRAVQDAGDQVIAMGQTRRRAYAARRPLRGQWAPLPVFQVNAQGEPSQIGRLHLAHGHGCWLEGDAGWPQSPDDPAAQGGWHEGLPCPLQDMRPEGFLGRAFARAHAALLQVPEDPREWSDDDTLHALSLLGSDTPGNLIVGDAAYQRWAAQRLTAESQATPQAERATTWLQRAADTMQTGHAGSSAAGEFPKFTAAVQRAEGGTQHVLVKFSGLDDAPGSRRWAELLVCEHLALEALQQLGVPAARSRILQTGGRTFLEVDRFDRHGAHGRSPVCSWQAVGNTLLGDTSGPWPEAGRRLRQRGLIAKTDDASLRTLGLLWHFGRFIQNSDMHPGNLAFVPAKGRFQVAPAYDMLPMHHAPVRGVELPSRGFDVSLPLPDSFDVARPAAAAAWAFWQRSSQDERIGAGFRDVCARNAEALERLRRVMG